MKSRTKIWLAGVAVLLAIGMVPAVQAQVLPPNKSPAVCGSADTPETGIQGDAPGPGWRQLRTLADQRRFPAAGPCRAPATAPTCAPAAS